MLFPPHPHFLRTAAARPSTAAAAATAAAPRKEMDRFGCATRTYKNKSVDTSDIRYCAKFQPFVTSNFAKNGQKRFCEFLRFWNFVRFDLKNDLQIQI